MSKQDRMGVEDAIYIIATWLSRGYDERGYNNRRRVEIVPIRDGDDRAKVGVHVSDGNQEHDSSVTDVSRVEIVEGLKTIGRRLESKDLTEAHERRVVAERKLAEAQAETEAARQAWDEAQDVYYAREREVDGLPPESE